MRKNLFLSSNKPVGRSKSLYQSCVNRINIYIFSQLEFKFVLTLYKCNSSTGLVLKIQVHVVYVIELNFNPRYLQQYHFGKYCLTMILKFCQIAFELKDLLIKVESTRNRPLFIFYLFIDIKCIEIQFVVYALSGTRGLILTF